VSNTQLPPQGIDPIPLDRTRSQDPRLAALSANAPPPAQTDLLSAINTIRQDSESIAQQRGDAVVDAVAEARQQEAHQMNIAQGFNILRRQPGEDAKLKGDLAMTTAKLQGQAIKNETATTDLELKKAKAAQDGTAPLMDQEQNPGFASTPANAQPSFPQDGVMAKALLVQKHGNIAQGTLDLVNRKIQQNTELQNLADGRTSERRTDVSQYIQDELARGFAAFEQEKTLRNGPLSGIPVLGTAVDLVGGLLNLTSGDYQLGSEIFGGTPDAGQKLDMLTQVSSRVGPMVNAELRDLLGQQRLEQSNAQYVGRRGATGLARGVREGDMEHLDQRFIIALDARRLLQTSETTKALWNTDIINGPRMSFNEFENMEALNHELSETTTRDGAFVVGEKLMASERRMHEHMQAWLSKGGTMESFKEGMIASTNVINNRYQKEINSTSAINPGVHKHLTNEKVVAFELNKKMAKWASIIESKAPANIRGALGMKLGENVMERHDGLQDLNLTVGGGRVMSEERRIDISVAAQADTSVGAMASFPNTTEWAKAVKATKFYRVLGSRVGRMPLSDFTKMSKFLVTSAKTPEKQAELQVILDAFLASSRGMSMRRANK
tara:strand:- start:15614 stop:17443 length:1830 start_codon:yes stop_codon:yes gene_type:complete